MNINDLSLDEINNLISNLELEKAKRLEHTLKEVSSQDLNILNEHVLNINKKSIVNIPINVRITVETDQRDSGSGTRTAILSPSWLHDLYNGDALDFRFDWPDDKLQEILDAERELIKFNYEFEKFKLYFESKYNIDIKYVLSKMDVKINSND